MAEKKNEIAEQKKPTFSMVLSDELVEKKEYLPANFNVARFVQNSVALVQGNDLLMDFANKYGSAPIKACLIQGAFLGLDAFDRDFYTVPHANRLTFMISPKGAIKLIKKYSIDEVVSVHADVIKNGDEYDFWEEDGEQHYSFHRAKQNRGNTIKAFAVVKYRDGHIKTEVMELDELETTRKKSKMPNGMAWKDFTDEMYKKTVIHRLAKNISLEFDNPMQKQIFDDDGAINIEKGNVQEEYHDFNEQPKEVVVESTVIDDDVDLPDFMKG